MQQRDHLSLQICARDTHLGVTCREERFPKGGDTRAQCGRLRRWGASEETDVSVGDTAAAGERGREVADHARPREPLSDLGAEALSSQSQLQGEPERP